MNTLFKTDRPLVVRGDCLSVMGAMKPESVDAIVTDPPYGLAFMGAHWDHGVPGVDFWRAALRVLKPGGHLLAFGGTRTAHRLVCAIEDAGFEIRDSLVWMYGSGFPKSLDVSKAIDKVNGEADRLFKFTRWMRTTGITARQINTRPHFAGLTGDGSAKRTIDITAPATPAAAQWSGWGTALKPAHEPCCVARKPLVGTVAANVLAHGTGGINVDGCRIGTEIAGWGGGAAGGKTWAGGARPVVGRWPANVALDEEAAAMLDAQTEGALHGAGAARHGSSTPRLTEPNKWQGPATADTGTMHRFGDTGGASRFFYTAKVSPSERGDSTHPTMKPVDLMRWLVRLVTPPGGLVLDPFAGSGTTGVAAYQEGFRAILVEREADYAEIAQRRCQGCV